jgi:predicted DNA-binding WGR domain protein
MEDFVAYYRVSTEKPDLFGRYGLVREWGRIERPGQPRIVSYPTQAEAQAAFRRHRQRKEKRGYR